MKRHLLIYKNGAVRWLDRVLPKGVRIYVEAEFNRINAVPIDVPPIIKRTFIGFDIKENLTIWTEE